MINDLVPAAGGNRGRVQGSFGRVLGALSGGGTAEAQAQDFQATILGLYEQGVLTAPSGSTVEQALVALMNAVFTRAGLTQYVIPNAPTDPNAEFVIEILTNSDYDMSGNALVKTNFGRAALIVDQGDFAGPVILSIIQKSFLDVNYVFPVPPGISKIAEVFEFSSSSAIAAGGTVLSICDDLTVTGPAPKWLLHDDGGQFAQAVSPNVTGHVCPSHSTSSARRGGPFWARGLNAAGSFLASVFGPTPLYASHSLAHAIIVDELSPWTVGESADSYTIRIIDTGGSSTHDDASASFGPASTFVFWLEISSHGVVLQCPTGLALTDILAQATATSVTTPVSTADNPRNCTARSGTYAWLFELANPIPGQSSSGVIDITVDGEVATPQITYTSSP
jgi:hypothetical protein